MKTLKYIALILLTLQTQMVLTQNKESTQRIGVTPNSLDITELTHQQQENLLQKQERLKNGSTYGVQEKALLILKV
ncbi:hypothetical protein [Winogradskyella ursingii]|uniref:hypothetical protein n=1 Tax=Winogradskyella ursingii TaxID=2686079 RepID=UPI0015CDF156|nr:hypothetical protein [Winogradskyella ursingii]